MRMAKITTKLDKGKGHVYLYHGASGRTGKGKTTRISEYTNRNLEDKGEGSEGSNTNSVTFSVPAMISTGFRLGPSSEGRVSGNSKANKGIRKLPSSWKRNLAPRNSTVVASVAPEEKSQPTSSSSKRKQSSSAHFSDNKTTRHANSSVASELKPLPSQ